MYASVVTIDHCNNKGEMIGDNRYLCFELNEDHGNRNHLNQVRTIATYFQLIEVMKIANIEINTDNRYSSPLISRRY